MSIFTSGLVMSHYTFQNISKEAKKTTHFSFDSIGYLAEAFVYCYLGSFYIHNKINKI